MAKKSKQSEPAQRLERLFRILEANNIDGAVIDQPNDAYYFSGYTGADAVVVLSTSKRKGWLVTDSRYTEEAETSAPGLETVIWKGNFAQSVGKLLRRLRMKRLGHTPATLTVAFQNGMDAALAKPVEWVDIGKNIADLRAVKSAGEIEAMAKALACAEAAFLASKKRWRVGMTEVEVKNDLEWEMRKRGAVGTAFETIVAVGANASLPHAHSGDRKVQAGKMLLIDFGAHMGRYNSDLTRTLWAGEIPKVWLKRYRTVLAAQRAGMEAMGPGVPCRLPDLAARKVFAAAGMEEYFNHSLGHGIGLAVHEEPRLSQLSPRILEPGNIVTVEPGVYFPRSGGIRVEDMVLITENGMQVLSSLRKDEESLVF